MPPASAPRNDPALDPAPARPRADDDRQNVWFVELGAQGDSFADFAAFQATIAAAPVTVTRLDGDALPAGVEYGPVFDVTYASPSVGTLAFSWAVPLTLDGAALPLAGHPRYDKPWAHAAQDLPKVTWSDPDTGGAWRLTFDRHSRGPACATAQDCWR